MYCSMDVYGICPRLDSIDAIASTLEQQRYCRSGSLYVVDSLRLKKGLLSRLLNRQIHLLCNFDA